MSSLLLVLAAQAWADCAADLTVAIEQVEAAFAEGDHPGAVAAAGAMDAAAACLTAPVAPRTAAQIHRAHAFAAHSTGANAVEHLQAMRRADPWLVWEAGPDHPLTVQLHAAEEGALPSVRALPPTTDWRVDGLAVPVVPTRLPAFVQVAEQGRVVETWLGIGDKVSVRRGSRGSRAPWTIAGAASGTVAAALYGGAWAANSTYQRAVETGDDPRVLQMHGVTNGLTVGSLGAAGVAASLLAVGFTR